MTTIPDDKISTLSRVITSVGEFRTEETVEELTKKLKEAKEGNKIFTFKTIITEIVFGKRIHTCEEIMSFFLDEVNVYGFASYENLEEKPKEKNTNTDEES